MLSAKSVCWSTDKDSTVFRSLSWRSSDHRFKIMIILIDEQQSIGMSWNATYTHCTCTSCYIISRCLQLLSGPNLVLADLFIWIRIKLHTCNMTDCLTEERLGWRIKEYRKPLIHFDWLSHGQSKWRSVFRYSLVSQSSVYGSHKIILMCV